MEANASNMIEISNKYIKIDTLNTSLIFWINNSKLETIYYGNKIKSSANYEILHYKNRVLAHAECDDEYFTGNYTFSTYGENCDREFSLIIKNQDNSYANRFIFKEAKLVSKPNYRSFPSSRNQFQTVAFIFDDEEEHVRLIQYYSCFLNTDVIASSNKIINLSNKSINIVKAMSLQLDLDGIGYNIHSFFGAWARERQEETTLLKHGVYQNSSTCGMSSHKISPFFYIDSPKRIGGCYGFNLIYSGNHKHICEASTNDISRFMIGLNDFAGNIILKPNKSFTTPEAIMTYGKDLNAMSQSFHSFINNHLINNAHNKNRPIVYNSWCLGASYNKETLMDFANKASDMGIELFVIDDAWYTLSENNVLLKGDWIENITKTGGIRKFSDYLHSKNLKFGLWFEPEVVSPESNLYKSHKDWIVYNENRETLLMNKTYLLDFSNKEVQNYIYNVISKAIENYNLDYIKWDFNRKFVEGYSKNNKAYNNFDYHYYKGLYNVLTKLTKKYPKVLFEGCAAGGGRFDLGILYYMPQIWTSDCIDAFERVFIQQSTIKGFAPSTISCHVGDVMHDSFGKKSRLRDRFAVAIEGNFGYEINFNLMSKEELEEMKYQINLIKPYKKTIQFGDFYSVETTFENNLNVNITVNAQKTQAVARIYKTKSIFNKEPFKYKFMGLNPNYTYKVRMYNSSYQFIATGDLLNNFGIDLENFFFRDRRGIYDTQLSTLVVLIDKI